MAITTNSSYVPTINQFIPHWAAGNTALSPLSLLVRLLDNTTRTQAQFLALRNTLLEQQETVQECLTTEQIVRSTTMQLKVALLGHFHLFAGTLDGFYQNTVIYDGRPYAPMVTAGEESFRRPMVAAAVLWKKVNEGPAPEGVTLPLVLPDGTDLDTFKQKVQGLQDNYDAEQEVALDSTLARGERNRTQEEAYQIMKLYRETVPTKLVAFPILVESMPRLTPQPGHTPEAVNASAIFQAPNATRVVYEASNEATLERYELRGTVGDHYDDEDAVVIASHTPEDPREFVTQFGLNQPGAEIALKVFVILTTGNEAGSAPMLVERPANVQLLAA